MNALVSSILVTILVLLLNLQPLNTQLAATQQMANDSMLNYTFNLSRHEFLEQNLGAHKRPSSFVAVMSTIYILILICGLFGNISTCCVIILNSCMHTTTNYYLFSLAVSDVLSLLIGLPVELTELFNGSYPWIFGKWFCKIRIFLFETTTIASVLTILMFTCERWLHICKAIYAKKFSSGFSRALKIILFIWAMSGFLALPYAFTSGEFVQLDGYPESKLCGSLAEYKTLMSKFIIIYAVLFFIVPMTMISIMYILIGIKLWRSQDKLVTGCETDTSDGMKKKSLKKRIRLLLGKSLNRKDLNQRENSIAYDDNECDEEENKNYSSKQYTEVSSSIHTSDRVPRELEQISDKAKQSRRDVVKMLFVVVLGFFICWAPFHFQRLWSSSVEDYSESDKVLLEVIYYISGVSIYISSTINPILYNLMSKRYRTVFQLTIRSMYTCQCSKKSFQMNNANYLNNKTSAYYSNKNSVHFNNISLVNHPKNKIKIKSKTSSNQ